MGLIMTLVSTLGELVASSCSNEAFLLQLTHLLPHLQVVLSDFFTGGIARMRQTGHTLQSQLHAAGLALKVWQAQKELEAMEK